MQIPENGFYYHYKHDKQKDFNNYSYEVTGIAFQTETEVQEVIYRPLYKVTDIAPATYFARPLEMFLEEVEYQGKTVPRFVKITDIEVIKKLTEIRD